MAFLGKRSVKKLKPADGHFITINLARFDAYVENQIRLLSIININLQRKMHVDQEVSILNRLTRGENASAATKVLTGSYCDGSVSQSLLIFIRDYPHKSNFPCSLLFMRLIYTKIRLDLDVCRGTDTYTCTCVIKSRAISSS